MEESEALFFDPAMVSEASHTFIDRRRDVGVGHVQNVDRTDPPRTCMHAHPAKLVLTMPKNEGARADFS